MILENGTVRTMEAALPVVRALAIAGDRIAGGVGTHETALASPERVDLGGRCVLPGLNDSHVHFPTWSLAQKQVRLEDVATLDEALERIAAAARDIQPGHWLRGTGWRSGDWSPPTEPTKEALDRVTGDTPAALMARDYHSLWLNSAALAHANGELEVAGGLVVRDADGEPTGVLREECAWHFRDTHVRPTEDEMVEAAREGVRIAISRGVTAVQDKDGWLGALGVWQRLRDEGSLHFRVWQSIPADQVGSAAALHLHSGFGDDLVRVGYLKAFMDGTLGSQTARMLDGSGVQITSREELVEIIRRGAAARLPIAVHAIGDLANREALDAFEQTREAWQPLGLRPRIEHAQLLTPEDIPRFAQLGVAASVQFSHAPSDREIAERFWAGKTDRAYAYRSLRDAGALLANGSDAPIEELDPWAGVCAGVQRDWHPEQRLTLDEALEATTVNPAWLARDEHRRGKLLPGYLADLVVLDRDPYETDDLTDVRIVATMLGGRWTHNPPPWEDRAQG
jgi:predicted amidohydrolase YtcJ